MSVGFTKHNHAKCISSATASAETYCVEHGLQFTKTRRRVLELLLSEHKAMGAYDLLAILSQEGLGTQPPIIYRALDFLVVHGFAHKIEKLNAYSACANPGHDHAPVFMICRKCAAVLETQTEPLRKFFSAAAKASGFIIERTVVEIEGICPSCAKDKTT